LKQNFLCSVIDSFEQTAIEKMSERASSARPISMRSQQPSMGGLNSERSHQTGSIRPSSGMVAAGNRTLHDKEQFW
jgi:hypothetical protein